MKWDVINSEVAMSGRVMSGAILAGALPPQPGDRFVYLAGPAKGEVVRAADLPPGGPQIQAYPAAPDGAVRDASRLNLVILARFDPAALAEAIRARAADGTVAYSGVCTHQGCPVNQWSKVQDAFVCSCHGSVFDPRDGRRGAGRTGAVAAAVARCEDCGRRHRRGVRLLRPRRRHAELTGNGVAAPGAERSAGAAHGVPR